VLETNLERLLVLFSLQLPLTQLFLLFVSLLIGWLLFNLLNTKRNLLYIRNQ